MYLDALLADEPLTGGLEPRLGPQTFFDALPMTKEKMIAA
jgi:hypothetical protein